MVLISLWQQPFKNMHHFDNKGIKERAASASATASPPYPLLGTRPRLCRCISIRERAFVVPSSAQDRQSAKPTALEVQFPQVPRLSEAELDVIGWCAQPVAMA